MEMSACLSKIHGKKNSRKGERKRGERGEGKEGGKGKKDIIVCTHKKPKKTFFGPLSVLVDAFQKKKKNWLSVPPHNRGQKIRSKSPLHVKWSLQEEGGKGEKKKSR